MEIAIAPAFKDMAPVVGIVLFVVAVIFVVRSFYAMRIPTEK